MAFIDQLKIDAPAESEKIVRFIRDQLADLGKDGVVIGLSGGLDSSACAYLISKALNKKQVLALILPEKDNNPLNMQHAHLVSQTLKFPTKTIEITPLLEQIGVYQLFSENERSSRKIAEKIINGLTKVLKTPSLYTTGMSYLYGGKSGLRSMIENKLLSPYSKKFMALAFAKVRLRMLLLYYYAALNNYLVIGTTDKSEWTVGFYDKYGDGANDLTLLRHLYKTQIRQLAWHLGLPKEIIQKPSSGDLVAQLPNEALIGFSYEQLDQILYGIEKKMPDQKLAEQIGVSEKSIQAIKTAIAMEQIKRDLPRHL